MDAERVRAIVKKLPHVEETVQWGENLVFWVGDKAVGGKMFALVNMDADGRVVMSFSAGPERYAELLEREGVLPAPYFARIHWVALEHWGALDPAELAACLAHAHALTYARLPQRTRDVLSLPAAVRRRLIEERRSELAARKATELAEKQRVAATPKDQGGRNRRGL
jgi:predicted DNA-binding protein (MmcQ/YjbR family)